MDFSTIKNRNEQDFAIPDVLLAKTRKVLSDGIQYTQRGCDIYTHLWTTCRLLQQLQKLWNGYPRAKMILPEAQWLAASHDIGKVSPGFVCKICEALGEPSPFGKMIREKTGGHARCSEIILDSLYGPVFARLAANHHGGACWQLELDDSVNSGLLGGASWQKKRLELLEHLQSVLSLPPCDLTQISEKQLDLITGAVILADWLSSSMDLPYGSVLPSEQAMDEVIFQAGLVPLPWKKQLTFEQLFGFTPNLLQKACGNRAKKGAVYCIESGMGSGKTEAALYLVHQLMQQNAINGVYFAMPTKLTSEKIFDRLNEFLAKGAADGVSIEPLLIHGDSWLDWNLSECDEDGNPHTKGSWFQTKKRALLAPFAAGTVDQALLSVVNVKHRALRAFALAGKAVILDEVHSYDDFTGSLINALIQRLLDWGATVIILSATLTASARAKLLGSSRKHAALSSAYPLLSIRAPGKEIIEEIAIPGAPSVTVQLKNLSDENVVLGEALARAADGQQILWIENTVSEAQKIFRLFQTAAAGIECDLIHSRFPQNVRLKKESYWVGLLGKNGADSRKQHGRILVATQVLEQSVDVDADFLVSRLAPGDMLLQRIGRLWRHELLNPVRPKSACREAWILTSELFLSPEKLEKEKAAYLPYDPYCMLRTFRTWIPRTYVIIPDDIRNVLEEIYRDQPEEGAAAVLKKKMELNRDRLEHLAFVSQGSADKPLSDEHFTTRVNEYETVQLLLIQKNNGGFPLSEQIVLYGTHQPVRLPSSSAGNWEKVNTAKILLPYMITIPEYQAPRYEDFPTDFLRSVMWTGDDDTRPVRAAFVDESGELLTLSGTPAGKLWNLSYHEKMGFCARKKEVL